MWRDLLLACSVSGSSAFVPKLACWYLYIAITHCWRMTLLLLYVSWQPWILPKGCFCPVVSKVLVRTSKVICFVFLFASYSREKIFGRNFVDMAVLSFFSCFWKIFLDNRRSDFIRHTWLRQVQCVFFLNLLQKTPDFFTNGFVRLSFQSLSDFVKSRDNENILNRLDWAKFCSWIHPE